MRTIAWCVHCTKLWEEHDSLEAARACVTDHYRAVHPNVDPPVYEEKVWLEATVKPVSLIEVLEGCVEQLALWAEAA